MAGVDALRLALGMAVVVLSGQQLQACIFGSQPGCAFACNCANNATCDETTGACPNGCRDGQPRPPGDEGAFDWRGPGCRIGNVAHGKSATQSGTLNNWIAGRAVDGRLPPSGWDEGEYCAHTNTGGNAWWSVDLEGTYSIHNITIFNRRGSNGDRAGHINITVSNSSDFIGASICVFYLGPLATGGNVNLPCGERLVGRYVKLQRTGGVDPNIISICEVVVMGHEVVMAYCGNCLIPCSELSFIVGCGECFGYVPPHCAIPCTAGNFGINCLLSCSDHHCKGGHTTCNHVTGECVNGCDNWYLGDKCIEYINEPKLGNKSAVSGAVVSYSQVNVTWVHEDTISANKSQYYGYQVQYKITQDSEFEPGPKSPHVVGKSEYSSVIDGLHYNTLYTLRVNAYRQHGELFQLSVGPTAEVRVKTSCIAPIAVNITRITTGTATWPFSISVEWQSAPSGCYNISSIEVLYRHIGDWMRHKVTNPTTSTNVSLTARSSGTWEVIVRVMNNENIASDSKTLTFTIQDTTVSTVSTQTATAEDGDSREYLITLLAVLFGISAVIIIGFIFNCIRSKLILRRANRPTVQFEGASNTDAAYCNADAAYEGLGPVSRAPEGPYDELHVAENQVPAEPEYELM